MIAASVFVLAGVVCLVVPDYELRSGMAAVYFNITLAFACWLVAALCAAKVLA